MSKVDATLEITFQKVSKVGNISQIVKSNTTLWNIQKRKKGEEEGERIRYDTPC